MTAGPKLKTEYSSGKATSSFHVVRQSLLSMCRSKRFPMPGESPDRILQNASVNGCSIRSLK